MKFAYTFPEVAKAAGLVPLWSAEPAALVDLEQVDTSQSPRWRLGQLAWDDEGNVYRYVQVIQAVLDAGQAAGLDDALVWGQVTRASTGRVAHLAAGVGIVDIPRNDFGWIQVGGYANVDKTSDAISEGVAVGINSTEPGQVHALPSTTTADLFGRVLGYAIAEAAAMTTTVRIHLRGLI